MGTIRISETKTVVVHKEVLHFYEVPCIDLKSPPTLQVGFRGKPDEAVYLDGVLLRGAKLSATWRDGRVGHNVRLSTLVGDWEIQVANVIYLDGIAPRGVEPVEKTDLG